MPTDPYVAPGAGAKEPAVRPLSGWVLAIALVPALLAALVLFVAVPQFEVVFRDFGASLPAPTDLMVRWYALVWLWPLVVVAVFARWRRHRLGVVFLALVSVVGSGLLVAIGLWAMYLPLFELAATI